MNMIPTKCKCGKNIFVSADEFMVFGNGVCTSCLPVVARFIRNRMVYFYGTEKFDQAIVDKIIAKEFSG